MSSWTMSFLNCSAADCSGLTTKAAHFATIWNFRDRTIRPDLPKGTPLLPKEFPPSIWPPARRESAEGISA